MINSQAPTLESIRRRARQRLIGAAVLVLVGVVALPLVFDRQPRPVPIDIAIEIPDRYAAEPLAVPTEIAPPDVMIDTPAAPVTPVAPTTAPTTAPAPAPKAAPKAAPAVPRTPPRPAAAVAPAAPAAASERLVVQVGAFAQQARAQEVRNRLERAGLATYTQVAQTAEGPRIRVRLGPFNSRAEAERAAERARQLGLTASILTL